MPKAGLRSHQFSISFHNFWNRIHFSLEGAEISPLFVIEILCFYFLYFYIFYILPDLILFCQTESVCVRNLMPAATVGNVAIKELFRIVPAFEKFEKCQHWSEICSLNREKKWCRRQTGKLYFSQQTLSTSVYFCNLYIKNYKYCTSTSLKNRFFLKSRLFSALSCKNAKRCWLRRRCWRRWLRLNMKK